MFDDLNIKNEKRKGAYTFTQHVLHRTKHVNSEGALLSEL